MFVGVELPIERSEDRGRRGGRFARPGFSHQLQSLHIVTDSPSLKQIVAFSQHLAYNPHVLPIMERGGIAHMSRLALSLLGPPRIERDGIFIYVDTRKAIAL